MEQPGKTIKKKLKQWTHKTNKIALLVDGDNAPARLLMLILEEASKYGKVTIRRIYGDWTTPHMNKWKTILNELAFNPFKNFPIPQAKTLLTVP